MSNKVKNAICCDLCVTALPKTYYHITKLKQGKKKSSRLLCPSCWDNYIKM